MRNSKCGVLSFNHSRNSKTPFDNLNVVALKGFPGASDGRESACNAGDPGSIPGLGRAPGGGNCNPLQYSCLVKLILNSSLGKKLNGWGHSWQSIS